MLFSLQPFCATKTVVFSQDSGKVYKSDAIHHALKIYASELLPMFACPFHYTWKTNHFHPPLKLALQQHIPKKGEHSKPSNYLTIAWIYTYSKVTPISLRILNLIVWIICLTFTRWDPLVITFLASIMSRNLTEEWWKQNYPHLEWEKHMLVVTWWKQMHPYLELEKHKLLEMQRFL